MIKPYTKMQYESLNTPGRWYACTVLICDDLIGRCLVSQDGLPDRVVATGRLRPTSYKPVPA